MTHERETLLTELRAACPAFGPECDRFMADFGNTPGGLPLYILMGSLVVVTSELMRDGNEREVAGVLGLIERWLEEGDEYTQALATIGFLEDLQNANLHRDQGTRPEDFLPLLGPRARHAWGELNAFWATRWEPRPVGQG